MLNGLAASRAAPRRGDQPQAVPQHRRAEHRQQHRGGDHRGENAAVRPQLAGVDRASVIRLVHALERGVRQPIDERRRAHASPTLPRRRCISTAVITEALSDCSCSSRYSATCSSPNFGQQRPHDEPDRDRDDRERATTMRAPSTAPSLYLSAFITYAESASDGPAHRDRDRRAAQRALGAIAVANAANDTDAAARTRNALRSMCAFHRASLVT